MWTVGKQPRGASASRNGAGQTRALRSGAMLWRARISSFAVGFSCAAAYGSYVLRADLQAAQAQLLEQARRPRAARRGAAAGRPVPCGASAALRAAAPAPWTDSHGGAQARGFEARLAKLEAK